jgi:hypothetical protein
MPRPSKKPNRYKAIIENIFFDHWKEGDTEFEFARREIKEWATKLDIDLPDNIGDVIYSFRFRSEFPERILATEKPGLAWRIELAKRSHYRFVLGSSARILPREELIETKIPDATPELIGIYALDDEQALLAVVRYNRLVDIFFGLTTYSLQNHLRTTVKTLGGSQVEIDELYVGLDKQGTQYVIPVQAKGRKDQISVVQTAQDIKACAEKFGRAICRPLSVQFMENKIIAMFELTLVDNEIKVVDERHYRLVPATELVPTLEEMGL